MQKQEWRYVDEEETGLYYLRSRYYHSNTCRFVNSDSILPLHYDDANNCNLFTYCKSSPIQYIDITGNDPKKGQVEASGKAYAAVLFYEITYIEGTCWDGYGNVAKFRSYVGIPPEATTDDIAGGIGMVGVSATAIAMKVNADTVYDLAGIGCYVGAGFDVGLSLGIDGIVLGKQISDLGNDEFDGWQLSLGVGIGLTWVHTGNSYTEIMLIEKEGIPVPEAEQFWTDTYPVH